MTLRPMRWDGWAAVFRRAAISAAAIDIDSRAISLGKPRRGIALMHGPLSLYLAGRSHEAAELGKQAAEAARTGRDTELRMYSPLRISG